MKTPANEREMIACRTAQFFEDGNVVNLGIGMPTQCLEFLPEGVDVWVDTENGAIGLAGAPGEDEEFPVDIVDGGVITEDSDMVMGINSRKQMSVAEAVMRNRILDKLMDAGVTIMDPASTFIEASVKIGRDAIIYPYTWLEGNTVIGEDCEIGPNARFTDVEIGNGCNLHFIYGHECKVMDNVTAGPYVHLRPNTVISNNVKIGNFVEVKNSNIGVGTKLPHLQYIGDSDIGANVNMGCGCITVNYDSKKKHRTVIGDNAFVGCNTNLVAPVTVEANTYIGAGSTITKDVPENALGIARAKQRNIEGWAEKYRNS